MHQNLLSRSKAPPSLHGSLAYHSVKDKALPFIDLFKGMAP